MATASIRSLIRRAVETIKMLRIVLRLLITSCLVDGLPDSSIGT